MAEILDENGVPFPYWPISGLAAGENSQVMILRVRAEADAFLYASADPRATVYGRARDTVQWFDLAQDPPGLEDGGDGYAEFEVYVYVANGVGLERIPLYVGAGVERRANWTG